MLGYFIFYRFVDKDLAHTLFGSVIALFLGNFCLDSFKKWWKNRKSNGQAWKISIKQIQERNYNMDFKNPNGKAAAVHKSPEELVKEIEGKEARIAEMLGEIKKEI